MKKKGLQEYALNLILQTSIQMTTIDFSHSNCRGNNVTRSIGTSKENEENPKSQAKPTS